MSPEDNNLQGDDTTIPNIDRLNGHEWSPTKNFRVKKPATKNGSGVGGGVGIGGANNSIGTNAYSNNTMLNQNGNDSHTWLPLLSHQNAADNVAFPQTTNNNKWPVLTSPANLSNSKYSWRALPQDDDAVGLYKPNTTNGNSLNGIRNGGSNGGVPAKTEHESLTGVVRHPLKDYSNDEYGDRSDCGIGLCKPKWARMFASTHVFMVIFLLAWILQGMYFTYFVSVITTIEKLFQIKSKTTGLLMSATEVGQICTSLFLTYFAGRGHRPRWIACGMIVFALAAFGCTLPHFIFGDDLMHSTNAFYGGSSNSISAPISTSISSENTSTIDAYISDIKQTNQMNLCHTGNYTESSVCEEKTLLEQKVHSQIRNVILGIFFVSLLFVGIGQTAVSTLGIPYIDDNVASKESAIYIAITIGVRILGPAAGFILGSFCTRLYVDLSNPGFGPSDPKWVGAWYLGLVMISSLMIVTSIAMLAFPKQLRGNRIPSPHQVETIDAHKAMPKVQKDDEEEELRPTLKDFPKTIKRHLKNDILMFRTASSVLHLLPIAGLYTFLPKYLESQFHLPAHDANLITGLGGILVMGIGIVASAIILLKFNPTARSVAAWIAFTALMYSMGMAVLMFIGCSLDNFVGLKSPALESRTDLNFSTISYGLTCNQNCECDRTKFSPICGADGLTYYSSCYAGCHSLHIDNGKTQYFDCDCIESTPDIGLDKVEAVSGFCDGDCQNFIYFIILFSFLVFVHSTSEVGSMLLIMRCTDPKDKAMAMGIIQFAISLFGNVPCPIIYGAVIDSTCLIWETICERQGACSLYDPDAFRHFFLGTTAGIMFLAFIMDVVVWHKANRIDIDPGSKEKTDDFDNEKPTITPESSV